MGLMESLRSDAARNRAQILDAARDLTARQEPLAMNALARRAGVGVGTVYRHFASVLELEETLVGERFDELSDLLDDAGPGQLDQVLTAHLALLVQDPLFERVIGRAEPALERTTEQRNALIGRLAELMTRDRSRGPVRTDIDAAGVLVLMCGLAHAMHEAGIAHGSDEADVLLRVVLDGLRAR
jgi:AcrR family transcriptional regulator